MPGIYEYIERCGGESFGAVPFGDADNLTFCQVFYMPFEQVVPASFDAEPTSFVAAVNELFARRGYKHKKLGLMIPNDASVNMMRMAVQPRFASLKLYAVQEVFETNPAVQFCAGTFLLPDGTAVVIFRGTDDSITGWKEDLDIFVRKGIPSYPLAIAYLKNVAAHCSGDIIICGHSKGGHLGLFAALKSDKAIRDRIVGIYNNDGPGYCDYSVLQMDEYDELLPRYRHLVPHSSFVGMMLAHDYDYTAVRSSKHLGPMQHDMASWQIDGGKVVTQADVDILAKLTDVTLSDIVTRVTDAQGAVVDYVANVLIEATGETYLTGLVKHAAKAVGGAVNAWKELAPDTKETFKSAFKGAGKILVNDIKHIKEKKIPDAANAAAMLVRRVTAKN